MRPTQQQSHGTRNQAAQEAAEESINVTLSRESGAFLFDFSDDLFDEDTSWEGEVWATQDGGPDDIPIPEIQEQMLDKLKFSSQQEEDPTLEKKQADGRE